MEKLLKKESYVVAAADSGSARPNQLGTGKQSRGAEDGTERPTPSALGCTSSNAISGLPGPGETGLGTLTSARGRCRLAEPGAVNAGSELPPRPAQRPGDFITGCLAAERPNHGQGLYVGKEG